MIFHSLKSTTPIIKSVELNTDAKAEKVLKGIPSSPGLSMGKAVIINPEIELLTNDKISSFDIPKEIDRLDFAINELTEEFTYLLNKVQLESKNISAVIEANIMILNDSFLIDSIKKRIKKGYSSESSVIQEFDSQKQFLLFSKDSILKERVVELDQIKERLIHVLRNKHISFIIGKNSIVIAQSLLPTDVVQFRESKIAGIITEVGGISAHSSILARSFDITEVIGVKDATSCIEDGSIVIIDGNTGIITINPTSATIENFKLLKSKELENRSRLTELISKPSTTIDGYKIHLMANVNFPEDLDKQILEGAEGIGLLRTENLVIESGHFPNEEEQFNWYERIVKLAFPKPVTFRAFDMGSDKYAEGMPKHESNPALGFRGIRFLLHRKDIFKSQILAVLRTSAKKNARFMIPMVSTVNEVLQTLELLEECKVILREDSVPFDENMPVGIMIETPASALQSSILAKYCNFFSIGTNDLTQYTLAADRTNELVSETFDSFHPAVIKLIKMTIDSAKANNITVAICGELGGHAASTALLIGLGIDELSVTPPTLLELKKRVRTLSYSDSKILTENVLKCNTYNEVRQLLENA